MIGAIPTEARGPKRKVGPKGPLRCAEREGSEQHTSQQDTSQGLGWPHKKPGGEATFERPDVRRLKDGKAVVPAARAPHARPPPCYLRLARVMKAPPRPLSQKRAAEGLQGRVRRARVYVLSPAAGAARRSTPLPLRGPRASLERFTHYSDGFYGVFLPENAQNPCCSVAVKKESILSRDDSEDPATVLL